MERTNDGEPSPERKHIAYKWIVLSVTTIGSLMAAIDGTIVILGLPDMMTSLHSDLVEMVWVIMAYILVSTIFLLTFGRVADLFGRVRMYNLGFVIFTIGSLLCGISATGWQLILARMMQGAGGAMMVVNSVALITEVFPPNERGRALGINAITWAVGGVIGPILGGLILSAGNWRWIFYINVPIGIAGALWGYRALHEISKPVKGERFDPLGAFSFSLGLTALLVALTLGISQGWTSTPILALFALAVVGLVFFFFYERRAANPVLDFNLFRHRVYTFSVLAAMLQSLALFAVNFMVIFYLQGVRGFDPLKAALLMIPLPVVNSVIAPLSGNLSDRIGARLPATLGLLVQAVALYLLTTVTVSTSLVTLGAMLALLGAGGGMFFPPNTSAAMNDAPQRSLGVASATMATLRQAGMVTSFALSLAVAAASLPRDLMLKLFVGTNVQMGSSVTQGFVMGMHSAFLLSLVLCLVAAGISLVRGREDRAALAEASLSRRSGQIPETGNGNDRRNEPSAVEIFDPPDEVREDPPDREL